MKTITHIVQIFLDIERPNRDIYNLDLPLDWVKNRVELFNRLTLPTLLNQTFQDFRIFLICGNKHKAYTSSLKWNKRVELCYGKGTDGTITTDPGYPEPKLKIEEFGEIDADYIAITRLDSDDLFHREAMADVRDAVNVYELMTAERECMMFRKYIVWDVVNRYIFPVHHKPSPPFYIHIFPKAIYKDYERFASQHFLSHRYAVPRNERTKELPANRICVVHHRDNISRIKKNKTLRILSKEERDKLMQKQLDYIFSKQRMCEVLRDFSVASKDIEGDAGDAKHTAMRPIGEAVDIIFLTCNQSEMSIECLDALKKNTHHPFRLIWIDNGSAVEEHQAICQRVEQFDHIAHRFGENRFYAHAINQGLAMARSRYVLTLSNDVFVTDGWLSKLMALMTKEPGIGLISPLTDNIGSEAPRASAAVKRFALPVDGKPLSHINTLAPQYGDCTEDISMFCALINIDAVNKIGLLDERFFILGNDDDYCDRIRLAGYKTGVCLNCFVYHRHEVTKNMVFRLGSPERMAIKKDHQALLREKRVLRAKAGVLE